MNTSNVKKQKISTRNEENIQLIENPRTDTELISKQSY